MQDSSAPSDSESDPQASTPPQCPGPSEIRVGGQFSDAQRKAAERRRVGEKPVLLFCYDPGCNMRSFTRKDKYESKFPPLSFGFFSNFAFIIFF